MSDPRSRAEAAVDAKLAVADLLGQLEFLNSSWLWWRGSVPLVLETFLQTRAQLGRAGFASALDTIPSFPMLPFLMLGARRTEMTVQIEELRQLELELDRRILADPNRGIRPMAPGVRSGGLKRGNDRVGGMKLPAAGG